MVKVVDLFFITDAMELLHTQRKQHETCEKLNAVLGESLYSCEIGLADSFQHGFSCLPPEVAEILGLELSDNGFCSQTPASDMKRLKKVDLKIDNSLIPSYTLLQIHCVDQKGLLYDVMRTLKDYKIQAPERSDLFIQQPDGMKIIDPEKQNLLCSRLRMEMLHPLRVMIANHGWAGHRTPCCQPS
ncbi:hypothetical protein C4D60_Mb06t34030 [Musa balbisiana]|uniref:ACT domain-containing protein ACR n=1 Tax=Musa balbisiana TaxID=52838 RepID=A0A4S8ISS8_MUSBA|nr:hypothetical protein C4D60_Mb06t34030 [Musa balbisiana]